MFETSIFANSVATTCASLNIPVIAYSPLGRGILSGKITSADDIPAGSLLGRLDKYSGENLDHNLRLVQALQKFSMEYPPHTMAQLAMSWIRQMSGKNGSPVIIPISGSTKEENVRANAIHVDLTVDDLKKIDKILEENKTVGARAYPGQRQYIEG